MQLPVRNALELATVSSQSDGRVDSSGVESSKELSVHTMMCECNAVTTMRNALPNVFDVKFARGS
jgi:hypothetical protein